MPNDAVRYDVAARRAGCILRSDARSRQSGRGGSTGRTKRTVRFDGGGGVDDASVHRDDPCWPDGLFGYVWRSAEWPQRDRAAQFLPSRSAAPPAGGNAARGFASFPGGRSDTSGGEGGGARSSAARSSMPARSTSLGSGSNSAAPPASTSDFGSRASAGTAGSLSADSSNDAEGGYVDIGNMPGASGLLSPARQSPIEGLDDGSVGDPVSSGGPAGDAPAMAWALSRTTRNRRMHMPMTLPRSIWPSKRPLLRRRTLRKAAWSHWRSPRRKTPNRSPRNRRSPAGLFPTCKRSNWTTDWGFSTPSELATAPLQLGNRAAEGSEKTSETGRPSAADALPMPPAHSAVKPAKSEDNDLGEEVGLRPVALSSVVFAAMLVPVANAGRARGSSDRRRSSP